jgi:hypothetical protein
MDAALEINDLPRRVPSWISADVPLVTIAWRSLRTEQQRRAAELRDLEHESKKIHEALGGIAEEVLRLRSAGTGQTFVEESVKRLDSFLKDAGVSACVPHGEPFTAELMELFDNIAQRPEPGISTPYVAEVVKPAILHRGAVLRMGKAVIAVPVQDE